MIKRILIYTIFCICISNLLYSQQKVSTEGKEFWVGFMRNALDTNTAKLFITSKYNTSGVVSMPLKGWSVNFNVAANQVKIIKIPITLINPINDEIIENKGIHITSNDNITIFAINNIKYSTDATCVLPKNALGSNTEYIVCSYDGNGISGETFMLSEFLVVALEDNTDITIIPKVSTRKGNPANIPFTIKLNKGQTYEIEANNYDDVTGSIIKSSNSCKPFAVFSGCGAARVSTSCGYADHLYKQNFPISTWGKNYISAPFLNMINGYAIRVIASEPNTIVTIPGYQTNILSNKGDFAEYAVNSSKALSISADKPISAVEYMLGSECNGTSLGDPTMLILNPNNQTISSAIFNTVTSINIVQHYVNIITRTINTTRIKLDNSLINASNFAPVPSLSNFSYALLQTTEGSHVITSDSTFIAYAYGYGHDESYSYSCGASFENLNYNFTFTPPSPCVGTVVTFTETGKIFPEYKWILGENDNVSGKSVNKAFSNPGKYDIKMIVPVNNGCSYDTITKTIEIFNGEIIPVKDTTICNGGTATLKISSPGNYSWSNGQKGSSITVTPVSTTTYTVTASGNGLCIRSGTAVVHVNPQLPEITLSSNSPICENTELNLIAELDDSQYNKTEYIWSGPDNFSSKLKNPVIVNSDLQKAGSYSLYAILDNCLTSPSKIDITINANPKYFAPSVNGICENDSVKIDLSNKFVSFQWSNNTTLSYIYADKPGKYWVTVTDKNGCIGTDTIFVPENCPELFYVPSAFSPDNDGKNDYFSPVAAFIMNYKMDIYTRWGELVYHTEDLNKPWDGIFNNKKALAGLYIYNIRYEVLANNRITKKGKIGYVSLLR